MRPTPALRVLTAALALALSAAAARAQAVPAARPAQAAGAGAAAAASRASEPVQASAGSAEALVTGVEKRYASIRSLTANFAQTFRSGEMGQQVVERGRIFVRRPGQMRWDYREPDKKVFVVAKDGSTLLYIPGDLRAVRSRLPAEAPHLALLMGQSDLLATFAASEVTLKAPAFPGSRAIKLVPRRQTDGIEMIYLEIEPRMMTVERVLVLDSMGNESDLVLDKVVENAAVKQDAFDVRIPPGVTVQDAGAGTGR